MFSSLLRYSQPAHGAKVSLLFNKRLILPLVIIVLMAFETARPIVVSALSDAFFQVSVFVAATLLVYYFLVDRIPQLNLSYLSTKSPILEIAMASILGALPGCGGAIIVVTQFTKKQASFASVVAVLTATMGDAAFLLLAKEPLTGLTIIAMGVGVGIVSGLCVYLIHQPDFCVPQTINEVEEETLHASRAFSLSRKVWKLGLLPSLAIALAIAFNVDLAPFDTEIAWLGAALCLFAVCVWAFNSKGVSYKDITCEEGECDPPSKLTRVLQDTHFVTAWVVASFLLYELSTAYLGLDLAVWFKDYALYAPLVAILVGLLPGCGPQIVVTTLYLQGVVPFSALAANAVANDGDALFPAIALAPRAALFATIYSAVPAFIMGYGLYYINLA
ncbi:putative manganese transporter [Pseudoalteromonas piscicida]|uniref:putative manganese transporter n=1 Tax=Pseudoalteromonas piscicida TaxID=43662 RepID=UPI0027E41F94|nr:putative manganese transporter [Pseudoalteromonas piscicida]WMO13506.1 putative manganese transporter [Pseudoalteromonas piscicida]